MLKLLSEIRELMHKPYCRLSIAERGRLGSAMIMFFTVITLVICGLAKLSAMLTYG